MEKETGRHEFNPEKYGMSFCPSCYGAGRHIDDEDGALVCTICGGFGWIRRESHTRFIITRNPVRHTIS
jgi:hypothetical protein